MQPSNLICKRFMMSKAELYHYANTCPHRYKTYSIDKRSGGKRKISQPSRDLKAVQRFVLSEYLEKRLVIHSSAKAYRVGVSIVDNAKEHVAQKYLLKMDFSNFFPSILSSDFMKLLRRDKIVDSEEEVKLLSKIFFMNDSGSLRLSIGSPGSPSISNAIMYDFDEVISKKSIDNSIFYTRYSDDITFSTNEKDILFSWPNVVSDVLRGIDFPKLKINTDKTKFSSKKFNRHVTGITLANQGYLSIGREKKRLIRARVHNAMNLDDEEILSLSGDISFACQVEPNILEKLWRKYPDQMNLILRRKEKTNQLE
ncbi:retron St85 family RNA-directed DNA polymerase [Thalassospira xiamenensis]|uniref:RNA-directed DNA polymerase n=1 Tax=Thalassospira xiamenensis TaxID=220697 RepID=A0A285RL52_9PROT|nr:retron St85 family RNA-directed DNA polymerase [Thalassospira xiamenensis]SOB94429.1 Retron-type reverse transcriptase [Thalassospira xiamenensis]